MKPRDLKPGQYQYLERGIFARGTMDGPKYGISYVYKGKRYREIAGKTKTMAKNALAIRQAEIAQGKFQIPAKIKTPLFRDYARQYLEHAKANKRSWKTDQYRVERLKVTFGTKKLSDITSWNVEQYKAARAKEVARRTVNVELSILRRMYNLAITWGIVEKSPMAGVKLFREEETAVRILSPDEERRLLAESPPHLRDLILVALYTGMRRGELLSLSSEHVDLVQRVITVTGTKTGVLRHIPISERIIEILRRRTADGGHVFTWRGQPIREFYKAWWRALRKTKITGLRFHDLRHSFATRLVSAGTQLDTVQELLGHRSILMTRRYTHPSPEHKRRAIDALSAVQSGTSSGTGTVSGDPTG